MKTFGKLFPLILVVFLFWNGKTLVLYAAVLNVPADYGTVQAAIDVSENGDTVLIADGIYTGSGNVNIDFNGKAITVESANGPDNCIIDCQNIAGVSGFLFISNEQGGSVLRGLAIINAHNTVAFGGGGGIFCHQSSPIIDNCHIENCRAENYGGGIYCLESSPIITNCVFANNYADAGAGIHCNVNAAPWISDCKFTDNESGVVGSSICAHNNSRPEISGCKISGTTGSGIWINGASAIIKECEIYNNSESGVAISNSENTVISNSILRNNIQSGLWCYIGGNITAYNCLMTGNFGGLSCAGSSPIIVNCTITGNTNGGINCFDEPLGPATTPTLINCIIWGNSGEGVQNWSMESPLILYSDLQELTYSQNNESILDIYPGGGTNISRNPEFTGFYALNASSPCRNRGSNSDNPTIMDLAGNFRIHENVIDLGAYECGSPKLHEFQGDVDDSGNTDLKDAISVLQVCVNMNPSANISADVNGDGKIGLQEAIFILQAVADIRELPVIFPDANLEITVRQAINKPTGYIWKSDLQGLTELNGSSDDDERNIRNIEGIQYCTNLTKLYLTGNQTSDLTGNQISDISAVATLTNLTGLYLSGNRISDMSAVAGLTNLTELYLANNRICDMSAVAGLTNLRWLALDGNRISNISAVAGLTNLGWVHLGRNQINNMSAVAGLTNLRWLHLGSNQISDINAVAGLTNLTDLYLGNQAISDISAVAGLTNLTYLRFTVNQISDISAVAGLTNLTELWLDSNQISDINAVAGLTQLTHIHLGINQVSDISAVAGLANLTWLWFDSNHISDISAVRGLMNLTSINCINNPLTPESCTIYIPELQNRGVAVDHSCP